MLNISTRYGHMTKNNSGEERILTAAKLSILGSILELSNESLCLWKRHLTLIFLQYYKAKRLRLYLPWWSSLTEDA